MDEINFTEEQLESLSKKELVKLVLMMSNQIKDLSRQIENLTEQICIMNTRTYGRKTEKTSTIIEMPQLELSLNEAEAINDTEENKEPELEEVTFKRRKEKGKKEDNLKKVTNRRDEYVTLSEEELNEKYGEGKWKKLPDELVFKLEHHPASFEAVTYHIGVYAKNDDETIVRAKRPIDPFPKSIATPTLVSGIITAKYVNAIPLYRLEKAYEANDINISRATMANWVIKASENHLEKFYEQIKEEMMKQPLLHADETPFEVTKDGRPAGSKSYMWVYRSRKEADIKAILYDYCHTRGHTNPEAFLKDFNGTLVCDGYGAYHQLENENPTQHKIAGCWVHLKRKFTDVTKTVKKAKGTSADIAVKKIQKIYHEEHLIEDLPPKEHLKKRKEKIEPLVDEFFDWIKRKINIIDSASATGRGFQYALNQEKYLRTFLEDSSIPLDNNAAEIAIRPFTIGRKNWVLIDTPKGAKASAIIYSIVETAKANNLKVYPYITYLLTELPKYTFTGKGIPASLLPWSKDLPQDIYK